MPQFTSLLLLVALALSAFLGVDARKVHHHPRAKGQSVAKAATKAAKSQGKAKAAAAAAVASGSAASGTATTAASNSTTASGITTPESAQRTRPCDQGDQSLAAGLQTSVVVGIGMQAAVLTLQTTLGSADDFSAAVDRLNQFVSTSALQLQMATGIADDGSLAQPQLAQLATNAQTQATMISSLTGTAADNTTLATLLQSFQDSTGISQDAYNNALIDCFLPTTAVSG